MSNWYAPDESNDTPPEDSANPFAAGDAWSERTDSSDEFEGVDAGDPVHIEGKLLIVSKGVKLPEICVKTGATRNLKQVHTTLKYSPPWAFAVGGVLLAAVMSKSCAVTYSVSKELVARKLKFKLMGGAGLALGIAAIIFGVISELMVVVGIAVVVIIASLICFAIGNTSLAIAKQEGGVRFWLNGCDASFLDKVARLPQ